MGGGGLPGPVLTPSSVSSSLLTASPPGARFPLYWHSVCISVHILQESSDMWANVVPSGLQSVREIVHIMHTFTVITNLRGGNGRQHRCHPLRLDTGRRVSRDVHAGGLRAGRDRLYAREERGAHHDNELHGVRHRDACLLGRGVRPAGGWCGAARDAGWLRSAVARGL